ncbi:MAG: DUF357 domain-containing protein [Cuniculiplasma sp.]
MTTQLTDRDTGILLIERVKRYLQIEREALKVLSICVPENSSLYDYARSSMEMIKSYYSDANHFLEQGDFINALSSLNYSYGWIDSGVRLGIFKTDGDYRKFTFYK